LDPFFGTERNLNLQVEPHNVFKKGPPQKGLKMESPKREYEGNPREVEHPKKNWGTHPKRNSYKEEIDGE